MVAAVKCNFRENNSGGGWWMERKDYEAMFAAGWKYEPPELSSKRRSDDLNKPFLSNDDVPYGWRRYVFGDFGSLRSAVESFEAATGKNFFEQGCNCCGAPFSISCDDGGSYDEAKVEIEGWHHAGAD